MHNFQVEASGKQDFVLVVGHLSIRVYREGERASERKNCRNLRLGSVAFVWIGGHEKQRQINGNTFEAMVDVIPSSWL